MVLFPRVNTLFAGQDLMASLTDEQQAILAAAADEAHEFATSATTEDFGAFCEAGGEVAIASEADVAALAAGRETRLSDVRGRSADEDVHR